MDYTKLGNTDIEISKICVGCMSFGKAGLMHDWTLDEEQTAEENSPLTKNTVPFVHQKKPEAFRSWFSFHVPSKPHTEMFLFLSIRFSSTQTAFFGSSVRFARRTTNALDSVFVFDLPIVKCFWLG